MSYLVLARKWRPRTFGDVTGQSHIIQALENALTTGRVHHAFLFAGTRGVGKTTIARILAKALNCEVGVSPEPCGKCAACVAVDEGRFIDLIEVDAASRTGVDDMRDLLDNVQYTPTNGRFKVYLIDEVHMLSRQSFNALLKTLEEPPPHVKFLFATTDPQKLPITVLSRCLQFNLKRLSTQQIVGRMTAICAKEQLHAELPALTRIGRAAAGSMRDGLSLLDQALAYGADQLVDADVAAMLGSMDRHRIIEILDALVQGDAAALLACISALDELAPDYEIVLDELATSLQRIAVIQLAGTASVEEEDELESLQRLSVAIPIEQVQLFYQIAVTSRRDLGLAPDPRIGFEMAMLRMLAFQPNGSEPRKTSGSAGQGVPGSATGQPANRSARAQPAPEMPPPAQMIDERSPPPSPVDSPRATLAASATATPEDLQDWTGFAAGLTLDGAVRQLAENCAVESSSPFEVRLRIERRNEHLLRDSLKARLSAAVQERLGNGMQIHFTLTDDTLETAAAKMANNAEQLAQTAEAAIHGDPQVQQLVDAFGGEVVPDSIQPLNPTHPDD